MSPQNNLHNSLKKALGDHTEPLHEAQWERLQEAMGRKPRRRFMPFLWLFLSVCLISGAASWFFLSGNSGDKPVATTSGNPAYQQDQKQHEHSNPSSQTQHNTISKPSETITESGRQSLSDMPPADDKMNRDLTPKNQIITSQNPSKTNNTSKPHTQAYAEIATTSKDDRNTGSSSKPSETPVKQDNSETPAVTKGKDPVTPPDKIAAETPRDKQTEKENNTFAGNGADHTINTQDMAEISKKKTSADTNSKQHNNTPPPPVVSRKKFVLSFSAGFAPMHTDVSGITNPEKQHKDTRSVFEQGNNSNKAFYGNLGFDWNMLPSLNIGLNSGIQYRVMYTPARVTYTMHDIPFYDKDGRIIGYLPDTAGIPLNSNSVNKTTFIYIPFRFHYVIPIDSKNELLIMAGANCAMLAGAKGSTVSLTEASVKPLDPKMYNRINIGLLGGLQYSRMLYDPWWLGAEVQWQKNTLKFDTGPGTVNSRLSGFNMNLILRYKF